MAMLEVKDLQVYYGVIQALKGISFHVNQGEVIALIGANGAGKTTTLQTLTGILSPKSGSIVFEGKDLTRTPAHKIVEMGMAHVPEGRRVFADMSVYENLLLGAYTRKDKAEIAESLASVYKRFPRLEERKGQRAGTLSGGEQQMLAMGRALMSKPRIILMDEPSMGLSPIFVNEIFDIIREVSPEPEYYTYWNTRVHGLTLADTQDAPIFPVVWQEIAPRIEGLPLVAHNKAFDESCLKAVFRTYCMDYPDYEFHCTLQASRRVLKGLPNYQLHTVAACCGYQLEQHHHALADAEACAWIAKEVISG